MSDTAPALQFSEAPGIAAGSPLTAERIEQVVHDFRGWLEQLSDPDSTVQPPDDAVDLHTLVSQFIGLKHEVNLQTKASRSALEQNSATLENYRSTLTQLEQTLGQVRTSQETLARAQSEEWAKPIIKGMIDIYDAIALSLKQVARQRDSLQEAFRELTEAFTIESLPLSEEQTAPAQPRQSFWSRALGTKESNVTPASMRNALAEWHQRVMQKVLLRQDKVNATLSLFGQALEGLITGYSMSLNRIERLLPLFQLEPMACQGKPFDPETMEVVDVALDSGHPPGEVIEEVRRGYRRLGKIYRYAQVRVAK